MFYYRFLLDRIEKSGNHIVDDNDEPLDLLSEMEDDSEVVRHT